MIKRLLMKFCPGYIDPKAKIEFTIGQVYEDKPAEQISCGHCDGTIFFIGRGSYLTISICANCLHERVEHDG